MRTTARSLPPGDPLEAAAREDGEVGPGTRRRDPWRAVVLRGVALVAAGTLLGGLRGALIAAVAVAATVRRSTNVVAAAAMVAVVVAAVATVVEAPLGVERLRSSFADDRPIASAAGVAAAILALVVATTLALRSRSTEPTETTGATAAGPVLPALEATHVATVREDEAETGSHRGLRNGWGAVVAHGPATILALATAVALLLLAPSPPAATRAVADGVRQGVGWGALVDGVVVVDGVEPPLPVVVTAVAPGGFRPWTAVAGAAAVVAIAMRLARDGSRSVALVAAGLVGVGLVGARADLAATGGAAAVALALVLGDRRGRTVERAAAVGALFGAACLCLPATLFLLPVLAAALTVSRRTGEVTMGHGAVALAAALAVVAPWQLWVVDRFATWAPAAEIEVAPSTVVGLLLPVVAVAVGALVTRRRGPTADTGDATDQTEGDTSVDATPAATL